MDALAEPGEPWHHLLTDYPESVLRVASLRADREQLLLFGWIELYPFDMIAPESWRAGARPWPVPGHDGWTCAFSATKMSSADALHWYGEAQRGILNIALRAPRPVLARPIPFAPEPAPGRFAVAVDAPFAMPWHDGPRIHRLVPLQKPSHAVWRLGRSQQARQWLKRHLGFDPFLADEWLGGLALVAPNPLCASVTLFRGALTQEGLESLRLQIVPRRSPARNADLTSLSLHVAERRIGSWTDLRTVSVDASGSASLAFPQPTGAIGYALVCRDRGLLRFNEPGHWIDQLALNVTFGSRAAKVEVPAAGRRKPAQTYSVIQVAEDRATTVGEPVDDPARGRLARLIARREQRQQLAAAPQKLFGTLPGDQPSTKAQINAKMQEAQDFIVSLVQQAQHRLIFVDPFFGMRDMRNFALRNMNAGVTSRILTSALALKSTVGEVPGFQVQQGLAFAADLRGLAGQLGSRTPQVRVMPGVPGRDDRAVIHDRYLIIDDAVWHCGPSFNELGERLGVVTRLPNPLEVRRAIGSVWRCSRPLLDMLPVPVLGQA
ncbi:VPA1262 family N-terminal domain-containing protein [Methylobacterium sp. B1]|uniref:VPA1262 family N-terminal domain-containing protein n=1 Tax=Methylobacterium sp. B1 TaxID=91459 RepID=UPI00034714DE|nr:VPA1262 family N-terminal domain-containing protein [Methylobacterium sp. B1]